MPAPEKTAKSFRDYREQNHKMITTIKAGRSYHVTGDRPQSIQEDLDSAVELVRQRAMDDGPHGILVTRLGPASFTVTLSAEVPYGTTQQSCQIGTGQR
jgi:hypothetical protein